MVSSIKLEPFTPEILDRIPLRWPEAIGNVAALRDAVEAKSLDHARVAVRDGRVLGAGGVLEIWAGVGNAWVAAAYVEPHHAVAAVKACLEGLDEIQTAGRFHRVQADIRRNFRAARRLALLLGFTFEGPMDGYSSDKSDYDRFARVRK